jgi:putative ABC transport system permease protein
MFSLYRTLSLRYFRLRWARTLLVVFSIALGIATWVTTGALNKSLEKAIRQSATPLAGLADLYVSQSDRGVKQELAKQVGQVPGVESVRPILIIQNLQLPDLDRQAASLVATDFTALKKDESPWGLKVSDRAGERYLQALLSGHRPALVGRELANALPPGSKQFHIRAGGKIHKLMQVGVVDAEGPASTLAGHIVYMDSTAAAAMLGQPGIVTRLDVTVEPGAETEEVRRNIQAKLGDQAQVNTPEALDKRVRSVLLGLEIGFSLCGAGALVVGMFLVYNSLAVSVAERRHDIGILRAVGATRDQIRWLFLGEAVVLGLAGTVLGVPMGLGLAEFSLGPMQNVLRDIFLPMNIHHLEYSELKLTIVGAMIAGLTTSLLAALVPSTQAASEEPADAVRRVPPSPGFIFRLLQVGASVALIGAGLLGLVLKNQLPPRVGTYAALVLVFPGALLLTPRLTALAARLLHPLTRRLFGIQSRLAADNLIRAPGRTGLVIGALAAGVALMLQTSGVIKSNEAAVEGWVEETIRADLFVTSGGPLSANGQNQKMREEVRQRLRRELGDMPGLHIVAARFRYIDWQTNGQDTLMFVVPMDAETYYRANKERGGRVPHLELFRRLAEEPNTAVVSENFVHMNGLGVGDTIHLPSDHGTVPLRIIGTMVDYSWNQGTVFIDRQQSLDGFNDQRADVFDVYLPPDMDEASKEALRAKVAQSSLATEHDLNILTRSELHERILDLIRRLYGLAYTQELVVGIVAALGVVAALLISVLQRRRELGLLRAVGATQDQVLRSVLAEAVLMGLIGTLVGLVVGVPFEWYVVRAVIYEEAGFQFPVVYPWLAAGVIAGLAMICATLAGLGPALHAVRLRIAEAIAYE